MLTPYKLLKSIYHSIKRGYAEHEQRQVAHIKSRAHRDILLTDPVDVKGSENFGLHMICCEQDFDMSLWALKTFYHFSQTRPRLYLHNDGSLSDKSKQIYREHFQGCQIIEREQADPHMDQVLSSYPLCQEHRRAPKFYCSLKLFDTFEYSEHDYVLNLDSDMLFFQPPNELLNYIQSGQPFFMSDYQNAYSYSPEFVHTNFAIQMQSCANAGLTFIPKQTYFDHLDFIERYFQVAQENNYQGDLNRHEQTLNIMLLSKLGARRLSSNYQVSHRTRTDATVMHHYVNDGSRKLFFLSGVKYLMDRDFTMDLI